MNTADAVRRPVSRPGPLPQLAVCVADITVDGGTSMPMLCLLTSDGELMVPTGWQDPLVEEGVEHDVRVQFRPRWAELHPNQPVPPVPEDYPLWRLRARVPLVGHELEPVRLRISSGVPKSLTAGIPRRMPDGTVRRYLLRLAAVATGILSAFVLGRLFLRAYRALAERLAGRS
ncbi:hypothetical protein [Nocardia crassostreae]|uniref:hypothetical protein n=1 Tax=Nocardia crassostreae TaxID=53428 RepID=UPI00082FAA93|nr:hypothetical protein [Nocardia crassostreae]